MTTMEQRENRIHQSTSYLWSLDAFIRKETNGNVYKGWQKKSPHEPRSVKVLGRISKDQEKEFEVLKQLNHENVVKLWSMERDLKSNEVALVMEYCNGSSLHSILDEPENAYGLGETDFMSLLRDLVCGLKHLRDYKIVHRNINPKNIVRHQTEDGRCVFKLFDFGTACHLEQDATFKSIYGEIEYQFPAMYENGIMGPESTKLFRASVDLWSIGVTLFQAATGQLPFRPYGRGRGNPQIMFRMTSEKASCDISCSQNKPDGPFNYSSTLPETCRLSTGLQNLLVPLLMDLFEPDQDKIMTYEEFFRKVETIVSKFVFYVFNISDCELLHVYCDRDASVSNFSDLVRQQVTTDVEIESKALFFLDNPNDFHGSWINENHVISSFLSTSLLDPILLIPNSAADDDARKLTFCRKLPKFPEMKEEIDLINDLSSAQRVCKELCYLRQIATELSVKQRLTKQATKKLNYTLQGKISELLNDFNECGSSSIVEFMDRIQLMLAFSNSFCQMFPENLKSAKDFEGQLEHYLQLAKEVVDEFSILESKTKEVQKAVNENLINHSPKESDLRRCHDDISHSCEKSIESRFAVVNEIAREFEKRIHLKEMGKYDEMQHISQKEKLKRCFSDCLKIIQETCCQNLQNIFERTTPFFCGYRSWSEMIESLRDKGSELQEKSKRLINSVDQLMEEMKLSWEKLCSEHHVTVLSRLQLLESELFKDFSYHEIIKNKFVFSISSPIYRELLAAGVLPSQGMSLSHDGISLSNEVSEKPSEVTSDVLQSDSVDSNAPVMLELTPEPFSLCAQPDTLVASAASP